MTATEALEIELKVQVLGGIPLEGPPEIPGRQPVLPGEPQKGIASRWGSASPPRGRAPRGWRKSSSGTSALATRLLATKIPKGRRASAFTVRERRDCSTSAGMQNATAEEQADVGERGARLEAAPVAGNRGHRQVEHEIPENQLVPADVLAPPPPEQPLDQRPGVEYADPDQQRDEEPAQQTGSRPERSPPPRSAARRWSRAP